MIDRLFGTIAFVFCCLAVHASSFIGFETVGPNPSTDGLVLSNQFRSTMGVRFSRANGSPVTLAKRGAPVTAFTAGADIASPTTGDSILASDPWLSKIGDFFVALSGSTNAALVIEYDYPTAAAAGLLIDVDPDETWTVLAYSDAGATLVGETIVPGGSKGSGDQTAAPWAITRPSPDIVQLRIVQTANKPNAGAALDLFFPYGVFDRDAKALSLAILQGPEPSPVFELSATPGYRLQLQRTVSLETLAWTADQTLTPTTAFSILTSDADTPSDRAFFRAVETPQVDRATSIYNAVNAFVATLTSLQINSVIFPANDATQRAAWSNFPTGIFQRNGLKIGSMTTQQITALWNMLDVVLSREGAIKIKNIVLADEALKLQGASGGLTFGTNEYYVSFVGSPSPTGKYLLQFGGHHLAVNATIKGAQATIAPALPGVQPATYTNDVRTIRPIGDEYDLSFALLNSMTAPQLSAAVLSSTVSDLALGPGKDGVTLLPEGIKASDLTEAQRAILLDLIGKYVNIVHDDAAMTKMAFIRANIADSANATYFSWRGPTTAGSAAYFRVQGPNLFIEYAPQAMGGNAANHIHAMYREFSNDYGALIP